MGSVLLGSQLVGFAAEISFESSAAALDSSLAVAFPSLEELSDEYEVEEAPAEDDCLEVGKVDVEDASSGDDCPEVVAAGENHDHLDLQVGFPSCPDTFVEFLVEAVSGSALKKGIDFSVFHLQFVWL